MSNSLLSLPAAAGERFRNLDLTSSAPSLLERRDQLNSNGFALKQENGNLSYRDLERAFPIVRTPIKKQKAKTYEHNYNERW